MIETAVLISIKPKWAAKILSGEKTVELRKSAPAMVEKVPVQFVCYIYESGTGMVTGEFLCDTIELIVEFVNGKSLRPRNGEDCLTDGERRAYANGKPLYGWHISSVKEYEMPLPLSAFKIPCANPKRTCCECQLWNNGRYQIPGCALAEIQKPPQSWRYVQVNQDRMEQMYGGPQDAEETARAMREAQRMFYADLSKVRGGPGRVDVEIRRGLSKDRTNFILKYGVDPLAQEERNAEKEN